MLAPNVPSFCWPNAFNFVMLPARDALRAAASACALLSALLRDSIPPPTDAAVPPSNRDRVSGSMDLAPYGNVSDGHGLRGAGDEPGHVAGRNRDHDSVGATLGC